MADPYANLSPEQVASIKYQLEHIHEDRRAVVLASGWSLWSMAVVAIILRFYAKSLIRSKFKAEDALILVAFITATAVCIINSIAVAHGGGLHAVRANIPVNLKLLFASSIFLFLTLAFNKFSILMFYRRTFKPERAFRIAVWCVTTFIACWALASFLVIMLQCKPVSSYWNKIQPGRCISLPEPHLALGIINVIADFVIVVMPMPVIWRLKMAVSRRIGVACIFLLAAIVIIASSVRLVYVKNLETYIDFTYDLVDAGVWSAVEPNIGIVGACLPLMTPFFRKVRDTIIKPGRTEPSENSINHPRLRPVQPPKSDELIGSQVSNGPAPAADANSDDVPLKTEREWSYGGSDSDIRHQGECERERDSGLQIVPEVHVADTKYSA